MLDDDVPPFVKKGDSLVLTVTTKQPGFAYVLHVHETNGEVRVLFPNKKEKENKLAKIGDGSENWGIKVGGPGYLKIGDDEAGNENLFAFAMSKPLDDMKEKLPDNLAPLTKAQKDELMSRLGALRGGITFEDDEPTATPPTIFKLVLKSID